MDKEPKTSNESAESIIKNHVIWSMGAGLIPIPFADFFAVSAVQLDMIRQLCNNFNQDFSETQGKAIISSLTTAGIARLGAGAIKLIPGVGSVIGGVTLAVLSGASTYALGEVFKKHFDTGGTILDFEVERLRKYYNEKFEKGKDLAKEWRKNAKDLDADSIVDRMAGDPLERIKQLNDLRTSGALTDEEFNQLKKQILG
ncbi:MAG: DUF697 domain-containing protein [Saprospiraceae bacterium]